MYRLVIGNRNYSSWSLRAWLYLVESGLDFEEIRIPLFQPGWEEAVARYSPAGRVPVLLDGDIAVWDSLAIMEYLREKHPEALDYPADPEQRARARSISAEMHSGFLALRDELPLNIRAQTDLSMDSLSGAAASQVRRVDRIWQDCRRRAPSSGPWLFGDLSMADILYIPVALRFVSYGIPLSDGSGDYVTHVCQRPSVRQWTEAAGQEKETIDFVDDRIPASDSPLVLG